MDEECHSESSIHEKWSFSELFIKSVGMGNCLCKNGNEEPEQDPNSTRAMGTTILLDQHVETIAANETTTNFKFPTSANIDKLVLEILGVIGLLVDK